MLNENTHKIVWVALALGIVAPIGGIVYALFNDQFDITRATMDAFSQPIHNVPKLSETQIDLVKSYGQTFFKPKDGGLYVNSGSQNQPYVVSEGQGYGMVITAVAGNRDDFDKLMTYYMAHLDKSTNLMAWRQDIGVKDYPNNATDGDVYIMYGLYRAYDRWHDEKYLRQANAIASDLLKYCYNEQDGLLTYGNWVQSNTDTYHNVRSSDIIPVFYEAAYQHNHDYNWHRLAESGYDIMKKASDASPSGLIPDGIAVRKGAVDVKASANVDGNATNYFGYNAVRFPLNMAMSNDSRAVAVNKKALTFINQQPSIKATRDIDGKVIADYEDKTFQSTFYAANTKSDSFKRISEQTDYLKNAPLMPDYYPGSQQVLAHLLNQLY